jgi:hypothetical protein
MNLAVAHLNVQVQTLSGDHRRTATISPPLQQGIVRLQRRHILGDDEISSGGSQAAHDPVERRIRISLVGEIKELLIR